MQQVKRTHLQAQHNAASETDTSANTYHLTFKRNIMWQVKRARQQARLLYNLLNQFDLFKFIPHCPSSLSSGIILNPKKFRGRPGFDVGYKTQGACRAGNLSS
jgi:hypothetical protein